MAHAQIEAAAVQMQRLGPQVLRERLSDLLPVSLGSGATPSLGALRCPPSSAGLSQGQAQRGGLTANGLCLFGRGPQEARPLGSEKGGRPGKEAKSRCIPEQVSAQGVGETVVPT